MRSKILLTIALLITVLALSGCGNQKETAVINEESKTEEGQPNIFNSIRDAMNRSLSLKCEYSFGDSKTTAYVKGKMIRIDGAYQEKSSATILKDDKIYSWDPEKKEGMILPINPEQKNETYDADKIIGDLEAQKNFCRVATVADSMFDPPADVKFEDLGKMMESLSGMPQNFLPTTGAEETNEEE